MSRTDVTLDAPRGGAGAFLAAVVAVLAGGALLVACLGRPPEGLCEPPVGIAHVEFVAAQALFAVALLLLRRAGASGASGVLVGATTIAWAALAGYVLMTRQGAGFVRTLRPVDLAYGAAGMIGLALLFWGMGLRFGTASAPRAAGLIVLALALSLGWMKVVDAVATSRLWTTWASLSTVDEAIENARGLPVNPPPGSLADLGIPAVDAWGHELAYEMDGMTYRLVSLGADGIPGPDAKGAVRAFADDLVIDETGFVSWPESPCGSGAPDEDDDAADDEDDAPDANAPVDLRYQR